jgi:hypothetical protein
MAHYKRMTFFEQMVEDSKHLDDHGNTLINVIRINKQSKKR